MPGSVLVGLPQTSVSDTLWFGDSSERTRDGRKGSLVRRNGDVVSSLGKNRTRTQADDSRPYQGDLHERSCVDTEDGSKRGPKTGERANERIPFVCVCACVPKFFTTGTVYFMILDGFCCLHMLLFFSCKVFVRLFAISLSAVCLGAFGKL